MKALVDAGVLPVVVSEPCAGAYSLAGHLETLGICVAEAYDLAPRDRRVTIGDARLRAPRHVVVSNPPYSQRLMLPILEAACTWPKESWWLVKHDHFANEYFAPISKHVRRMLPVGRVSWLQNGKVGYENSTWIEISRQGGGMLLQRRRVR